MACAFHVVAGFWSGQSIATTPSGGKPPPRDEPPDPLAADASPPDRPRDGPGDGAGGALAGQRSSRQDGGPEATPETNPGGSAAPSPAPQAKTPTAFEASPELRQAIIEAEAAARQLRAGVAAGNLPPSALAALDAADTAVSHAEGSARARNCWWRSWSAAWRRAAAPGLGGQSGACAQPAARGWKTYASTSSPAANRRTMSSRHGANPSARHASCRPSA